jgi:hypothetical protein
MIKPKLRAAPPDMNCTATALYAITGKPVEDIVGAMRRTSGDNNWSSRPGLSAKPKHWGKALEDWGLLFASNGDRVEVRLSPDSTNVVTRQSREAIIEASLLRRKRPHARARDHNVH